MRSTTQPSAVGRSQARAGVRGVTCLMEPEIIAFVSEFTGVKAEKISPGTLINFDLGVDGDDGAELLKGFSARFGVDLSPISETYFGPEGFPVGFLVLWPYYLYR